MIDLYAIIGAIYGGYTYSRRFSFWHTEHWIEYYYDVAYSIDWFFHHYSNRGMEDIRFVKYNDFWMNLFWSLQDLYLCQPKLVLHLWYDFLDVFFGYYWM